MNDLTLTTTILFFFCNSANGAGDVKDKLTFDRFREEKPQNKNNHFQNLIEVVHFSKLFIATKQVKQNESKFIFL